MHFTKVILRIFYISHLAVLHNFKISCLELDPKKQVFYNIALTLLFTPATTRK